ncbi:MAG: hypothetical protein LBQ49_02135 [Rickettsiales bacterium]|jgi:hypothetical protein|nr:hypothetical protein [Rickettsiales bacterium]
MVKKLSMEELIAKADAAKKSNPLDLSSDQDLSIAVMNLVSLEEHFFFSGGKTNKPGFYDLINSVREMRKELMLKLVKKSSGENGEVWCISKHLLAASMRLLEVGSKALGAGKKTDAYDMFGKAYDLYSLFWGINMDLMDLSAVAKDESMHPGLKDWIGCACKPAAVAPANNDAKKTGLLSGLGNWVKKAVDCCIE